MHEASAWLVGSVVLAVKRDSPRPQKLSKVYACSNGTMDMTSQRACASTCDLLDKGPESDQVLVLAPL